MSGYFGYRFRHHEVGRMLVRLNGTCGNGRSKGFTLLEVMIAVLVLSIGLLGLAALQAYAMRNNQSAAYRTQATNLAVQMLDQIRSHRGAGGAGEDGRSHPNVRRLIDGWDETAFWAGNGESPAEHCGEGGDALRCDRARWGRALSTQLPNGRARISFAGITGGADSGLVTIEICWSDDRASFTTSTDTCNGAGEGYGMKTVGPDGGDWPNHAYWLRSRI